MRASESNASQKTDWIKKIIAILTASIFLNIKNLAITKEIIPKINKITYSQIKNGVNLSQNSSAIKKNKNISQLSIRKETTSGATIKIFGLILAKEKSTNEKIIVAKKTKKITANSFLKSISFFNDIDIVNIA